jgi:hypothetical protein
MIVVLAGAFPFLAYCSPIIWALVSPDPLGPRPNAEHPAAAQGNPNPQKAPAYTLPPQEIVIFRDPRLGRWFWPALIVVCAVSWSVSIVALVGFVKLRTRGRETQAK